MKLNDGFQRCLARLDALPSLDNVDLAVLREELHERQATLTGKRERLCELYGILQEVTGQTHEASAQNEHY